MRRKRARKHILIAPTVAAELRLESHSHIPFLQQRRWALSLADIEWKENLLNSAARQVAFPLKEGDVFKADRIRESLDAYHKLYGAQAYIDFSAEPDFDVNNPNRRIGLTLGFDQQKQFHIIAIPVDNADTRTESSLRSMMRPGDVFDYDVLKRFFGRISPSFHRMRRSMKACLKNVKEGTVFRCVLISLPALIPIN